MTRSATVAYSELTRVLPWSLRALGYKFGTADRGAHLVATAAAMDPAVLDAMVQAQPRPALAPILRRAPGSLEIDARGVSLLEIGPVAVDCLAAHAGEADRGTCLINGATDVSLLPAIVAGASAYDMHCLALITGRDAITWHLSGPDGKDSILVSGKGLANLAMLIPDRQDFLQGLSLDRAAETILLVVGDGVSSITPPSGAVNPAEMVRLAQRRGIPVSQATLDGLYGLEMLTWAPTSERSRSQAGFTAPPVSP